MMDALTDAIFEADSATTVNTLHQQLQGEYLGQLLAIIAENTETGHTGGTERCHGTGIVN
jgi:hypothetical protein